LRSSPGHLDEPALLSYISYAWTTDPNTFCKKPSHLTPFGKVLWAWIAWRRNAIRVKGYVNALPCDPESEWMFRAAICSELRRLREEFLEMKVKIDTKDIAARNVICTTLGNVIGLDVKKDMKLLMMLRDSVCGVEPELVGLERGAHLGDHGGGGD
jgi:hypothetical protein